MSLNQDPTSADPHKTAHGCHSTFGRHDNGGNGNAAEGYFPPKLLHLPGRFFLHSKFIHRWLVEPTPKRIGYRHGHFVFLLAIIARATQRTVDPFVQTFALFDDPSDQSPRPRYSATLNTFLFTYS